MEMAVGTHAENIRGATVPRGEKQVFVGSSRVRRYAVRALGLAFALPPLLWTMSLFLGMTGFASVPGHARARLTAVRPPPAHVTRASPRQPSLRLHPDKRERRGPTV